MNKTEKSLFVDNLTEELKRATSVILVDYTGLSVKLQQDLKRRLSEVDSEMAVIKNTLLKLAGTKAQTPNEMLSDDVLAGPTAMIISEADPIAPLQVLSKFAKENDLINLKVGIVEGKFQDKLSLENLAKLPSKEILYAQLVGGVGAPLYGIVGTLEANIQKLLYILSTKSKQI